MTTEESKCTCKDCYYDMPIVNLDSNISIHWCSLYYSQKDNLDDEPMCKYFKPKEAEL